MLRTTKSMKEKYEKIQNYLFSLIPEKWDEIYLYASIGKSNFELGEMFFYYLPKGFLKKKAVNVYEVPKRFNINEEQYLKIVEQLYNTIKSLQKDFIDTEQKLWTNLTISIVNFKFRIEYGYEDLPADDEESSIRNLVWRYAYLKIDGENRHEREILEKYFSKFNSTKREIYENGIYLKTENSQVTFDREENTVSREFLLYEKENISNINSKIGDIFKKNKKQENKKQYNNTQKNNIQKSKKNYLAKEDITENETEIKNKNQILNN